MSVGFYKTGVVKGSGNEIGKNIVSGTQNFSGWTTNAIFTTSVEDGFTVKSAVSSGVTSNSWRRVVSPYIDYEDVKDGIIVSYMFKCDDYSALDHQCMCALQTYNSSDSRVGWVEPTLSNANTLHEDLIDGKWIKVAQKFTAANTSYVASGYTGPVTKINVTFNIVKNGSVHFKQPKIETGTILKYLIWIPNESDWGYIGNTFAFIESGDKMSVYPNHIQTPEFIEY